jgi:hypothetical protein
MFHGSGNSCRIAYELFTNSLRSQEVRNQENPEIKVVKAIGMD